MYGELRRIADYTTASIAIRRILVDHARRRQAGKRIPKEVIVTLEQAEALAGTDPVDILALDRALTGLSEVDSRLGQMVELRYFASLTESEVAEVLEVSRPTVTRAWRAARI